MRQTVASAPPKSILAPATAIYLLLPALLFALGWLKTPIALLTGALVLFCIGACARDIYYRTLRRPGDRAESRASDVTPPSSRRRIGPVAACLGITLWVSLSGAGGLGFQNADYKAGNALLKDLISQRWPLRMRLDGVSTPVVYYIGYYLPSAVVGKLGGWHAANAMSFLWTLSGVLLAFGWFCRLSNGCRDHWFGATSIFCLAGGLDYVGYYVLRGYPFQLSGHIEWWAEYFQYSSNTVLLYWTPQHAIAAWLVTALILDIARAPWNLPFATVSIGAAILWSPFGVLGAMPYLALATARYFRPPLRQWLLSSKFLIMSAVAAWLGSIHVTYLAANRFAFPLGFAWKGTSVPRFFRFVLCFWLLEFALLGCLLVAFVVLAARCGQRTVGQRASSAGLFESIDRVFGIDRHRVVRFVVCIAVLTTLPFFRIGRFNDLVMRGSIPSLFIFWTFAACVLSRASFWMRVRLSSLYATIVLVLGLGFFSSAAEMARSIRNYRFGPPRLESVDVTEELTRRDIDQRAGRQDSVFYRFLAR